ncbi:MAG: CorA family divalent cation transporter [Ignavibacteriaceae bacterium]
MESNKQQIGKDNLVFFLGGYDAEMVTIKKIIEEKNLPYFDRQLKWGAKLSEYKAELSKLSKEQIPVFIELYLDIDYPSNAVIIDHHNERSGKDQKTSIEQVADLLGVKLDRWQQLISANDKDLFKGMQLIDATDVEIKKINDMEKEVQGISNQDYKLAENSIKHFSEVIDGDIIIIHSQTKKTRPILEKLYNLERKFFNYKHIFILYKDEEFGYTGEGKVIDVLKKRFLHFQEKDNSIKLWYGGILPCRGYFGSNKVLTKEEIREIVNRPILSHHIFLFPFVIDNKNINKKELFEQTIKLLRENDKNWKEVKFDFSLTVIDKDLTDNKPLYDEKETWKYNEYNYFYDYARKSLFNDNKVSETPISFYFEKIISQNTEFIISVKDNNKCTVNDFHLSVDNISLHIFENVIGVISITLYNYIYPDFESVRLINDFGRRIYPQFIGTKGSDDTKNAFLPEKITFIDGEKKIYEDFKDSRFLSKTFSCANHLSHMLSPIKDFRPVLDDRMYTICWYGNNEKISELQQFDKDAKRFNYENSRDWYMFSFIDGYSAGIGNEIMKNKLIKDISYARFIQDGTLYGITRYSFVCLTGRQDYSYAVIRNHMQKMYYQMAILLLVQRASIVVFNNELSIISSELENDNLEKAHPKIENLQMQIIKFSDRVWFDEISPQEQGIELYQLAQKNMDINRYFENLKEKMEQTYSFVDLKLERLRQQYDSNISKTVVILSSLGAIFLPATFIAAIWAMEFYYMKYFYEKKIHIYSSPIMSLLRQNSYWISFAELIITILLIAGITDNMLKMEDKLNGKISKPLKSLPELLKISFKSKLVIRNAIILLVIIIFHLIIFF